MKYYKIIGIHPESYRLEELVSDTVFIYYLKKGFSAYLVYVNEELEASNGRCMKTSTVQEIYESGGIIEFETLNNVYTLKELVI